MIISQYSDIYLLEGSRYHPRSLQVAPASKQIPFDNLGCETINFDIIPKVTGSCSYMLSDHSVLG